MSEVLMLSPRRINEMQPNPRPGDRCVLVIFGAAGDLTKRLLVPALRNLRRAGLLPEEFAVIGVSRRGMDNGTFRRDLGLGVCKSADEAADDSTYSSAWMKRSLLRANVAAIPFTRTWR